MFTDLLSQSGFSPRNLVVSIVLLLFASFVTRFLMTLIGQKWIKTISHSSTILILPIVTFFLTKVISGNIALSLGMVGALSIVRFRNPVKSPFELATYFAAISYGIAASVNLAIFVLLFCTISLILLIIFAAQKMNKEIFPASFSEGNELSTLEITSLEKVEELSYSPFLVVESFDGENHIYFLSSADDSSLKNILHNLKSKEVTYRFQK